MDADKPETDDAAPISDAPRKRRRWTYAWSGAGIGVLLGLLCLWVILIHVRSSPLGMANWETNYWLQCLGNPTNMVLSILWGIGLSLFKHTNGPPPLPSQFELKFAGLRAFSCFCLLLNWGIIGLGIGWLAAMRRRVAHKNQRRLTRRSAWKGARIGAFLGLLTLGIMILFAVKSSNPEATEGMIFLQVFLGAPVYLIIGLVLGGIVAASHAIGISSQWAEMLTPVVYLSIPLNWGMFGFIIGWLVGNSRNLSTGQPSSDSGTTM